MQRHYIGPKKGSPDSTSKLQPRPLTFIMDLNLAQNDYNQKMDAIQDLLHKEEHSPVLSVDINLHEFEIRFHLYDKKLLNLIESGLPNLCTVASTTEVKATEKIHVHWHSTQLHNYHWSESGDHHCSFSENDSYPCVLQRDFACILKSDTEITLLTSNQLEDGLFNFLRFFAPKLLLNNNKFILHSSCVLNQHDRATLFLGHSGFGKSTISSMFPLPNVLGDDMNVVYFENNKLWIEPTHLGQVITNWDRQNKRYLVKNIFWLQKNFHDKSVHIEGMDHTHQRLKILGSFSGLFWDQMSAEETRKVFQFLQKLIHSIEIKTFQFNLNSEVQQYV